MRRLYMGVTRTPQMCVFHRKGTWMQIYFMHIKKKTLNKTRTKVKINAFGDGYVYIILFFINTAAL